MSQLHRRETPCTQTEPPPPPNPLRLAAAVQYVCPARLTLLSVHETWIDLLNHDYSGKVAREPMLWYFNEIFDGLNRVRTNLALRRAELG